MPPNASPGTGLGNAWFDPFSSTLHWNITWSGLTGAATAAHFHGPAGPGVNAGVQVGIGTANPNVGSAVLTAAQATQLLSGLWYVNIHTAAFPGGEIRGQVVDVGCVDRFECWPLSGAQEVPPNGSAGTGLGHAWLNRNNRRLQWHVEWSGLTGAATAAHFHGPAAPGVNAGVQVGFGTANPNVGSAALTATQASQLVGGLWYANIHTAAFPGGEIRGQVVDTGCPQWAVDGPGKPGNTGTPALAGRGPLTGGSPNELYLINGPPSSTAAIFASPTNLSASFKGGILVPFPDIIVLGLPTDVNGGLTIPFIWPVGIPAGIDVWFQEWCTDPGAHAGLSATNGLKMTSQ